MALNHTHDTLNNHNDDNKTTESSTKPSELKDENSEHGDLLDGRTLLEVEALLIMLITRMKIKGKFFYLIDF